MIAMVLPVRLIRAQVPDECTLLECRQSKPSVSETATASRQPRGHLKIEMKTSVFCWPFIAAFTSSYKEIVVNLFNQFNEVVF